MDCWNYQRKRCGSSEYRVRKMVYYNNLVFRMLVMTFLKKVVIVGMDYHHSAYIVQVREESSAKKLPEEYGQEDDSQEISEIFRHQQSPYSAKGTFQLLRPQKYEKNLSNEKIFRFFTIERISLFFNSHFRNTSQLVA